MDIKSTLIFSSRACFSRCFEKVKVHLTGGYQQHNIDLNRNKSACDLTFMASFEVLPLVCCDSSVQ